MNSLLLARRCKRLAALLLCAALLASCAAAQPVGSRLALRAQKDPAPQTQRSQDAPSWAVETNRRALLFAVNEPCPERAEQVFRLYRNNFTHEAALFDLNEDGTPELLLMGCGVWQGWYDLYDLSGQRAVYLGHHWYSYEFDAVYRKETGSGPAWRMDGNYSHGQLGLTVSELLLFAGDGLHVYECAEQSEPFMGDWTFPLSWTCWVRHSLLRHGRSVFDREEERLHFASGMARAWNEAHPPSGPADLIEQTWPVEEMEQRMQSTLYRQLLEDDWVEVTIPWAHTSIEDPYETDARALMQGLYEGWLNREG